MHLWMKEMKNNMHFTKHSEKTKKRLSELNKGNKNKNWRGGKKHGKGYIFIYSPEHPFNVQNYVLEHRLIFEDFLRKTNPNSSALVEIDGKKYLKPEIIVHHINEIQSDNRIENLQIMTHSEHNHFHNVGEKNPNYGKSPSIETIKKMKEHHVGMLGKHLTDAHKKKLSELRKGEKNPFYGKHHTDEWKRNKSSAWKGSNNPIFRINRKDITRGEMGRFVGKNRGVL